MKRTVAVAFLTLLVVPASNACAEPTKVDLAIAEMARREPTFGLIFMEVKLFEQGQKTPKLCDEILVSVVSDEGNSKSFTVQLSPMFFVHASGDGMSADEEDLDIRSMD